MTERADTRTARPAGLSTWRVSSSFPGALVVALLVATASVSTSRPAAASCLSGECVATSIANVELARDVLVPCGGSAEPATNGLPVLEDGACTATQEYHPNLDRLRPASDPAAHTSVHADPPASGEGHRVAVLPLAVGVVAAVAVGAALAAVTRRAYKLDC